MPTLTFTPASVSPLNALFLWLLLPVYTRLHYHLAGPLLETLLHSVPDDVFLALHHLSHDLLALLLIHAYTSHFLTVPLPLPDDNNADNARFTPAGDASADGTDTRAARLDKSKTLGKCISAWTLACVPTSRHVLFASATMCPRDAAMFSDEAVVFTDEANAAAMVATVSLQVLLMCDVGCVLWWACVVREAAEQARPVAGGQGFAAVLELGFAGGAAWRVETARLREVGRVAFVLGSVLFAGGVWFGVFDVAPLLCLTKEGIMFVHMTAFFKTVMNWTVLF